MFRISPCRSDCSGEASFLSEMLRLLSTVLGPLL
jgi:hypothetical protein